MQFILELAKHLKSSLNITVRMYCGEFQSKETMEGIVKAGENLLFIDFSSDNFLHLFKKNITISLYYVAATASSNEKYRIETKQKLINLIEEVDDELLNFKTPNNINTPKIQNLKKLQDGFTEGFGYVVVYERSFEIELTKEAKESML